MPRVEAKEIRGSKTLKSIPFSFWKLKTIFSYSVIKVSPVAKNIIQLDYFLEFFPRDFHFYFNKYGATQK